MSPADPVPDDADDDALLDGVLRVHPDDLVDFAKAFFAAMDAVKAGPASGGPAAQTPTAG